MANVKFSQFPQAATSTDVTELVGYSPTGNIRIPQNRMSTPSRFQVTGIFLDMFGGAPGGNGKDVLEFQPGTNPSATHSSVYTVLQNCKITAAAFKWISDNPLLLNASETWNIQIFKLQNPLTNNTVNDANFANIGNLNITLTSADNGTYPGKVATGLNIILNAGDIIRIAGIETGTTITSTDNDAAFTVLFETIV